MTELFIERTVSDDNGTFGTLTMENDDHMVEQLCYTAEPPPTGEHPCIPVGTYDCIPHNTPAHPDTWELANVPGRTAILIHDGNRPLKDTLGCILVGDKFGMLDGKPAVMDSKATMAMLRATLPAGGFRITVS